MRLGHGTLAVAMFSVGVSLLLLLWVLCRLQQFQWRTSDWQDQEKLTSLLYDRRTPSVNISANGIAYEPLLGRCEMPPGGYRAWGQGVVTQLTPHVEVNCSKLFSGDKLEVKKAQNATSTWKNDLSDEEMLGKMQDCSWLRDYFSNNLYNSELEKAFPLAFTLVVYDGPQQVLRLLRVLYRTQNAYCIHYDVKSPHKEFFQQIARCFDNVMIASRLENVVWGYYTILQAQMNCMTDLLEYRSRHPVHKWRYLVNLCGKELPLVSNRKMVLKMMRLNGTSSIVTETCKGKVLQRIRHPVELNANQTGIVIQKEKQLDGRPFDRSLFHKSSSYNALSFKFANHLISNQTARRVYEFFTQTKNAEEHFYATLYHTPRVPGGFRKHIPKSRYFEVAGSFWSKVNTFQKLRKYNCQGLLVHEVCVVGAGDLAAVVREGRNCLFHNKYFMDFDPSVMDCIEERLVAANKLEYQEECG